MFLFAQNDFWKVPSIWDVAGFVIGILSIWLAWYFARRDLRDRIAEAKAETRTIAERTSRNLIRLILVSNLAEVKHALDLCQESRRGNQYDRAREYLETADKRIIQLTGNWRVYLREELEVDDVRDNLRTIRIALSDNRRRREGRLTELENSRLQESIGRMIALESIIELRGTE